MLALCDAASLADSTMRKARDYHGRPRLPYVIDPSCGSGSFLIEYMKLITERIGGPDVSRTLPSRIRDAHNTWFGMQEMLGRESTSSASRTIMTLD